MSTNRIWGEVTDVVGTVTAKRVEGGMSDYAEGVIRISETEFKVSDRLYESVSVGQEVVLTFRGGGPIQNPDELKSKTLITITSLQGVSAQQRSQRVSDQAREMLVLEENRSLETRRDTLAEARPRAVAMCDVLSGLGLHANPLDDGLRVWIEILDGPIRRIGFPPATFGGREYCYVPDPRLREDLELLDVDVFSKRLKRFPVFGSVYGARWRNRPPDWDGDDSEFSQLVARYLSRDPDVTESIIASGLDVEVTGDGVDQWAIIAKRWPVTRWSPPILNCVNAVARSLLAVPLPPDD